MSLNPKVAELIEGDPTANALAVLELMSDSNWRLVHFKETDALVANEPIWAAVDQAVEHLGCSIDWDGENDCYIGYAVANILGWD